MFNPPSPSTEIRLPTQDANEAAVGKGFEVELGQFWYHPDTQEWVQWHERYLVVYSQSFAAAQIQGLQQRLERAQNALDKLAAKPGKEPEELNLKVEAILKRHRVKEFFCVSLNVETDTQTVIWDRVDPSVTQ
ncbi:hypothetical protein [Acaryochloris sp. CCMEE 5410]|uniref:hypothetical protein n=1 Tax=Acaryochloris sp. CCMEE 5410 TaxID=310037 RepID=UPI0021CEA1CC|nr:hypothetical protein [Acaryochloris sp. CCMEE 5410]